jgi:hypothetical protein
MSAAPRVWYVHKFRFGVHHSAHRMEMPFDQVDRLVAQSNRIYGPMGWSYEITDSAAYRQEFADAGAGI